MPQLMNSLDTANLLCIAPATLRKWRWEGKGPKFVKIGRRVVYRDCDINAFIDAQTRHSTSDTRKELS